MEPSNRKKPFLERLYELEGKSAGAKRLGIRAARYIIHLFAEFFHDEGVMRASGLAYVSLLGLVPLLALVFSLFSSFGAFARFQESMREFLLKHLIPSSTEQVINYIEKFLSNTKALSLIGVVFLLLVAVFIFNSIESAFNKIWKVQRQRSMIRKFLVFSAVVVWGPAFIGASIYAGGKIKAVFDMVTEIGFVSRMTLKFLPIFLNTFALFLAYLLIPNTKVRMTPALAGGFVAGVLWEFAKSGFNIYVKNMITYKTLYGSLALVPLFLIWLYVTWLIVLFGSEITFTAQHFETLMAERLLRKPLVGRTKLFVSLKILKEAARSMDEGEALNLERLAETLKLPYSIVKEITDFLTDLKLLRYTDEDSVVPAITPDRLALADAVVSIHKGMDSASIEFTHDPNLQKMLTEIENSIKDRLGELTLAGWARSEAT